MTTLLDLIKTIPGLGKAIANLIGDIGEIGSSAAKLASRAIDEPRHIIEDRTKQNTVISQAITESRVAMIKAITDASVQHIQENAAQIGERALHYGVDRLIREQSSREAVVMKTIEHLRDDPPTEQPADVPSDDWLNLFGRYAENASSEKMREHWAHILSGEIRKPGSFSFATLLLASILDERLAASIETVRPWIISNDQIPIVGKFAGSEGYATLLALAGAGFLQLGAHEIHSDDDPESPQVVFRTRNASIMIPKERPTVLRGRNMFLRGDPALPTAVIARSGIELLSVLPEVNEDPDLPEAIKSYFEKIGWNGARVELSGEVRAPEKLPDDPQ